MNIPVIDLFAGPGGLGEGFSSIVENQERIFKIGLSVEMDKYAHKTLELRSFFRQFPPGKAPSEYYDLLKTSSEKEKDVLKGNLFNKYAEQAAAAQYEAWNATLGEVSNDELDEKIRKAIKGRKDWVLIGGPPCQAYSMAGRSRVGGIDKKDHRVYLYKEYLRIIDQHRPAVFVMENVKGLLSAKLDGKSIFEQILEDLEYASGNKEKGKEYHIYSLVKPISETQKDLFNEPQRPDDHRDFIIEAEKYGIPQKRHRVILLGIRADLKTLPDTLQKTAKPVSVKEVIGNLPTIRSGVSRRLEGYFFEKNKKKPIYQTFREDDIDIWRSFITSYRNELKSLLKEEKDIQEAFSKLNKVSGQQGTGSEFVVHECKFQKRDDLSISLDNWYIDSNLEGVCNHNARPHMAQDLRRYLFSAVFSKVRKRYPTLTDYPDYLLPEHKSAKSGKFVDRFKVQLEDQPSSTITSHISKDGHYFIHYDPEQCRSFTVREAARIQTFPDNYLFCGPRTAQYHQVGNAVPPLLARQIAQVVKEVILKYKSDQKSKKITTQFTEATEV